MTLLLGEFSREENVISGIIMLNTEVSMLLRKNKEDDGTPISTDTRMARAKKACWERFDRFFPQDVSLVTLYRLHMDRMNVTVASVFIDYCKQHPSLLKH